MFFLGGSKMLFRRTKNRFKKTREKSDSDFALQITSLADILMIVLIFLLKAFTSGVTDTETLKVAGKLKLPYAVSGSPAKDGLKIEIEKDIVSVEGRKVAGLSEFRFTPADLNHDFNEVSSAKSLNQAFAAEIKHVQNSNKRTVWIVADHRAPYTTIQTVIASAALQGYSEFKLAVTRED